MKNTDHHDKSTAVANITIVVSVLGEFIIRWRNGISVTSAVKNFVDTVGVFV